MALHLTTVHGHATVVQLALKNGASINKKTVYGETALHLAALYGYSVVAQLTLEHGARIINEIDEEGCTALHLAARHGHATVVQLVLKNGVSVNKKTLYGNSAGSCGHVRTREGGADLAEKWSQTEQFLHSPSFGATTYAIDMIDTQSFRIAGG